MTTFLRISKPIYRGNFASSAKETPPGYRYLIASMEIFWYLPDSSPEVKAFMEKKISFEERIENPDHAWAMKRRSTLRRIKNEK